jgi:hypothetical protein
MKHEREREFDTSYFHSPHSPKGELSPLLERDGVDRVKGATESGSGSISPHILTIFRSVSCILCFSAAVVKLPEGSFLVGFRSNKVDGDQDCVERTHEARDGPHHAGRVVVHMVGPTLHGMVARIATQLTQTE